MQFFIRAATQLHEIDLVIFEPGAQLLGFVESETTLLECNAVDLDTDDEVLGNTLSNSLNDFNYNTRPVWRPPYSSVRLLVVVARNCASR